MKTCKIMENFFWKIKNYGYNVSMLFVQNSLLFMLRSSFNVRDEPTVGDLLRCICVTGDAFCSASCKFISSRRIYVF